MPSLPPPLAGFQLFQDNLGIATGENNASSCFGLAMADALAFVTFSFVGTVEPRGRPNARLKKYHSTAITQTVVASE